MTKQMNTVRDSLQAELEHARAGARYYAQRVAALESVLAEIERIDTMATGGAAMSGRRTRQDASSGRPSRARAPEQELPNLRGDFWLQLLTDEPRGKAELLEQAAASLGFVPSASQRKKLKQSLDYSLHHHVTVTGRAQAQGAGRARRFSRSDAV